MGGTCRTGEKLQKISIFWYENLIETYRFEETGLHGKIILKSALSEISRSQHGRSCKPQVTLKVFPKYDVFKVPSQQITGLEASSGLT
jgi:hypothetical protein